MLKCITIFGIIILLLSFKAGGQTIYLDTIPAQPSVPQRDITDYLRKWFSFKPSEKTGSMQPGDHLTVSVLPAAGYTLQTRLAAILSGNIVFYTSANPNAKLSVVNANITYTQNAQFTIPIQSNVWLPGNKWNLTGDWRYMKYPQSTFGLGSDASLLNEEPMDYQYIRIYQNILKKITSNFSAGIGYNLDYHWKISSSATNHDMDSDYILYGAGAKTVSSGITLNLTFDTRKNIINPLDGLLIAAMLRNNSTRMGSSSNWQSLMIDIRKYFMLQGNRKQVLALWSYNWLVLGGKPPYLDLPSTGWDGYNNSGRGFIQGRYRGEKMVYLESEYRFDITNNGLLGATIFANAESFSGLNSQKLQSVQPGAGLGLRIKLNKKSDTNIAIDYGFGTQGSKGLFVNIGEVF
ncbi:MAG: BamA/TamA family outer membrane protein [Bacteroidetes bacterium]|nr:BamA/TamA family outer membrane protein [Bacteroidota bacterium]